MAMIVAIDGPAGTGKSTVSRQVAQKSGLIYVDTGAIYRALALDALQNQISLDDEEALFELAKKARIKFEAINQEQHTFVDGSDVTKLIRTEEISQGSSKVGRFPKVRQALLNLQRSLALSSASGAVLEGRDIGTVVFPDAQLKIFLTASAQERANRRVNQLKRQGQLVSYDDVLKEIKERDERDSNREVAPLKPASDAIIIDTTMRSQEDVINNILQLIAKTSQS